MTDFKQEITPSPPSMLDGFQESGNQQGDLETMTNFMNSTELLFVKVQKSIGSTITIYRGSPLWSSTEEEQKYLDSHPDQSHWSSPYLALVYLNNDYIGSIEATVRRTSSVVELRVVEQVDLKCDNDLKCAQSKFNHSQADRKEIEALLIKKKPGDWLIRRGSNAKALVISIRAQDGLVIHFQFLPTLPTRFTTWKMEPGTELIEYSSIQDVIKGLGLLFKNSTFLK